MTIMNMVGGGSSEMGFGLAEVMANNITTVLTNIPMVKLTGSFPYDRSRDFYCGYSQFGNLAVSKIPAFTGDKVGFTPDNLTITCLASESYNLDNWRHSVGDITSVSTIIFRADSSVATLESVWKPYDNFTIEGKWCFISRYGYRDMSKNNQIGIYQLNETGDALETFEGTLRCENNKFSFNATYPDVVLTITNATTNATNYIVPIDCVITKL